MKPKKCKVCGNRYTPKYNQLEPCPTYECRLVLYKKADKKLAAQAKKEQRAERNKLKESTKKLSQYEAEAKREFQRYIRLRDEEKPCISCGTYTCDEWAGGHYYPAGQYSGLIFDERNCHKQCNQYCNKHLNGNIHEYRKGLIKRFGIDFVQQLDNDANLQRKRKYDKFELIEIKEKYKAKIKEKRFD